jgi:transposase-like protein
MSRFYSEAYKWSLYEKFYSGFTLTEICETSGVTDKPLREWFRTFDAQYARATLVNLREVRQESVQLRKKIKKAQKEMEIFQCTSIIEEIPEALRISRVQKLLKLYSSNQVCHSLKIRKSNLYYHILRKPETTVYEKRDRELQPVIQSICDESPKKIGAEKSVKN